jgi:hypothetical protein
MHNINCPCGQCPDPFRQVDPVALATDGAIRQLANINGITFALVTRADGQVTYSRIGR